MLSAFSFNCYFTCTLYNVVPDLSLSSFFSWRVRFQRPVRATLSPVSGIGLVCRPRTTGDFDVHDLFFPKKWWTGVAVCDNGSLWRFKQDRKGVRETAYSLLGIGMLATFPALAFGRPFFSSRLYGMDEWMGAMRPMDIEFLMRKQGKGG